MFSTGLFRRAIFLAGALSCASVAHAQTSPADATLYRVFLRDGSTLVSYGEFARVADRVVLSMPLGGTPAAPKLQLLSIPSATVDWEKTDAYAESARAARYAATRGPEDYAMLGVSVTNALTEISRTTDPQRKVAMAIEARQNVTTWVAEHFGYRAEDAARMATLFDDVVNEVRTAAGQRNFDLSLIANMAAPPAVPLMGAPSVRESLEEGFRAATLVQDASERTSLLKAIRDSLGSTASEPWSRELGTRVATALAVEARIDRSYGWLTRWSLRAAGRYARAANVGAIAHLATRVLARDDRLGHQRPQETASLMAALDAKLDAARRLRLARDQWAARAHVLARYRREVLAPLVVMRESRGSIDEIRLLAGPPRVTLARLGLRLALAGRQLSTVKPPAEVDTAHALLISAVQLAQRAATGRREAVESGNMQQAWDAASAASGALLLFDRAAEELQHQTRPPVPK